MDYWSSSAVPTVSVIPHSPPPMGRASPGAEDISLESTSSPGLYGALQKVIDQPEAETTDQAYEMQSSQREDFSVTDREVPPSKRPLETSGETLFSTSPVKCYIGTADRAEMSIEVEPGQPLPQKRHNTMVERKRTMHTEIASLSVFEF